MQTPLTGADVYTDLQGLTKLRASVDKGKVTAASLHEVAGQFEALFTQMMLKSMRQASLGDELFGSEQGDFYRDMHDQQLAILLSKGKGMGLSEMLFKQLGGDKLARDAALTDAQDPAAGKAAPENFVRTLMPYAERAAQQLGVAPAVLLAQAAHETGWGKAVPRHADGTSGHNLFGIKADPTWRGARISVPTVEYENGIAVRKPQVFRAYASYAESFNDYVNFLRSNPRYQEALSRAGDASAYTQGLQQAGYASDPEYANKLQSLLASPALQQALAALKNPESRPLTG
jgi:flagellar protein FlgJ